MKDFLCSPPLLLSAFLLVMSLILFITMGIDKRRAVKGRYRISERTLFTLAICCGAIGGWAGMYAFRHKTRHMKFVILFPLFALLQLAAVILLIIM